MIAVDSNILIYAHRAGTVEHPLARKALDRAASDGRGWGITLPSLSEFWRAVTVPDRSGTAIVFERAHRFMESMLGEGQARLWLPMPGFGQRLLRRAADLRMGGARIYDLQIALMAQEGGATEIWTHDRNFVAVPGLGVVDPLPP
jgi:predicted nucleic acid-binding protein